MAEIKLETIEFWEHKFLESIFNEIINHVKSFNKTDYEKFWYEFIENQLINNLFFQLCDFKIDNDEFQGDGFSFCEKKLYYDGSVWGLYIYLIAEIVSVNDLNDDFIEKMNLDKNHNNYKGMIVDDLNVIKGIYGPNLKIIEDNKKTNVKIKDNLIKINENGKIIKIFDNNELINEIPYTLKDYAGRKKEIDYFRVHLSYFIKILYGEEIEVIILFCVPNGLLVQHYDEGIVFSKENKKIGPLAPGIDKKNAKYRYRDFNQFELLDNKPLRIKVLYWNENMDENLLNKLSDLRKIYDNQLDD